MTPNNKSSESLISPKDIINQYVGLKKNYDPDNVEVIQATPDRVKQAGDDILEWWPPDEEGSEDFPRPVGYKGKTVLEFYKTPKNPDDIRNLVLGDLLHGLDRDPEWSNLKKQFIQNYTPKQQQIRPRLKNQGLSDKAIDDMYIRGKLVPGQGDEWSEPGRYSPKQLEILNKMREYLKTGEVTSAE